MTTRLLPAANLLALTFGMSLMTEAAAQLAPTIPPNNVSNPNQQYLGPNITRVYYADDLTSQYGVLELSEADLVTIEFPAAVTDVIFTKESMVSTRIIGSKVVIAALAQKDTMPIMFVLEDGRMMYFMTKFVKATTTTIKNIKVIEKPALTGSAAPSTSAAPYAVAATAPAPLAPQALATPAARPAAPVPPPAPPSAAPQADRAVPPAPPVTAAPAPAAVPALPTPAPSTPAAPLPAPVVPPAPPAASQLATTSPPPAAPAVTSVSVQPPPAAALPQAVTAPPAPPVVPSAPAPRDQTPPPAPPVNLAFTPPAAAPAPVPPAPTPARTTAAPEQPAAAPVRGASVSSYEIKPPTPPTPVQVQAPPTPNANPVPTPNAAPSLSPAQSTRPAVSYFGPPVPVTTQPQDGTPATPAWTSGPPPGFPAAPQAQPTAAPSTTAPAPAVTTPPAASRAAPSTSVTTPVRPPSNTPVSVTLNPANIPFAQNTSYALPKQDAMLDATFTPQFDGTNYVLYYKITNRSPQPYDLDEAQMSVTMQGVRVAMAGTRTIRIEPGKTWYGTVVLLDQRLRVSAAMTVEWPAQQLSTGLTATMRAMISVAKGFVPAWNTNQAAVRTITPGLILAKGPTLTHQE